MEETLYTYQYTEPEHPERVLTSYTLASNLQEAFCHIPADHQRSISAIVASCASDARYCALPILQPPVFLTMEHIELFLRKAFEKDWEPVLMRGGSQNAGDLACELFGGQDIYVARKGDETKAYKLTISALCNAVARSCTNYNPLIRLNKKRNLHAYCLNKLPYQEPSNLMKAALDLEN